MRSSSEDGKSHIQQWLTDGFERRKSCNVPQPATSMYNQDKTDDECEEAGEETEHYLPKEPTELEDMAEDHDGCDQKTDLNKALHPKIQDTDLKPQRATTGSCHARDNDGRDDRTEDGRAPKISVTINIIPTLGGKRREEHAPADGILVSVPGKPLNYAMDTWEMIEGTSTSDLAELSIPDRGQRLHGKAPAKVTEEAIEGTDRDSLTGLAPNRKKDNGPRTVKEIPEIGRGTASKHPSPPRNMPGRTAATPFVAPAPPYKGKKEEEQSPSPCCCIVL